MWQYHVLRNIFSCKLEVIIILDFPLGDSIVLLKGPGIYPEIMIELHVLLYLFVRRLINSKRGAALFRISQQKICFIFYNTQVFLGVISRCSLPFLHFPKKTYSSLLSSQKRNIPETSIWKRSLLICFESCHGVPYSYMQSRKRMANTAILVNTTLMCKRYFRR